MFIQHKKIQVCQLRLTNAFWIFLQVPADLLEQAKEVAKAALEEDMDAD
jgi:hypothetical protein